VCSILVIQMDSVTDHCSMTLEAAISPDHNILLITVHPTKYPEWEKA